MATEIYVKAKSTTHFGTVVARDTEVDVNELAKIYTVENNSSQLSGECDTR